jgi:DNA modification methylase
MRDITLITGDACNLKEIKDSSIDLIITAPPYITVDVQRYGGNAKKQINYSQNRKKMIKLLLKATKEMERVLKPSGSILIDIGHKLELPYFYVSTVLEKTELKLANPPFIWNYQSEKYFYEKEKMKNAYGYWFHFIKDGHQTYYNPFAVKKYNDNIWNIPWENEKESEVREKLESEGFILDAYNSEVAKRFIEMFTKPGHTVLDSFGGTGTTAVTAWINDRNAISYDISEEQTKVATLRMNTFKELIKNEK